MTHMIVQIPARITQAPRAAEPLANAALAIASVARRTGIALSNGLRSRQVIGQSPGHARGAETACTDGIGSIKG